MNRLGFTAVAPQSRCANFSRLSKRLHMNFTTHTVGCGGDSIHYLLIHVFRGARIPVSRCCADLFSPADWRAHYFFDLLIAGYIFVPNPMPSFPQNETQFTTTAVPYDASSWVGLSACEGVVFHLSPHRKPQPNMLAGHYYFLFLFIIFL